MENEKQMRRILGFCIIFSCGVFLLLVRFGYLQLVNGPDLAQRAWAARAEYVSLEDYSRGEIVDRQGRSLTDSIYQPGLVVFPSLIANPSKTAQDLEAILGKPRAEIAEYLESGISPQVLAKALQPEMVAEITSLESSGLTVLPIKQRYGPAALAEHLVGYISLMGPGVWEELQSKEALTPKWNWQRLLGWTNPAKYSLNDGIGVKGIERVYEEYLHAGNFPEIALVLKDATGKPLSNTEVRVRNQAGSEAFFRRNKVVLTLDRDIQALVEEIMDQQVAKGAVVVLDVATREVLALASRPGFDQNQVADYLGEDALEGVFLNRALNDYYPGSVFKVVVAAAAVNEGIVSLNQEFTCSGTYQVNEQLSIPCWNTAGHGTLTLAGAIAQSCNCAFIEIGQQIGADTLNLYAQKFGLQEMELLGYPLTAGPGLTITRQAGDLANASLGQKGVRLTPVMVASIMATIAGNGTYQPPQIVQEVRDEQEQRIYQVPKPAGETVISRKTAQQLQSMLAQVTQEGTGKAAWVEKGGSAGKTGSAQSGQRDMQGEGITDAWFAGYAPLNQPEFAIAVLVEGGKAGGNSAGPVFREIMERIQALPK